MGRIAGERARIVVVTDEDPRGEDRRPSSTRSRAAPRRPAGGATTTCWSSPTGGAAIEAAVERARPGDIVLLAGKGHEQSIIGPDGPRPLGRARRGRGGPAPGRATAERILAMATVTRKPDSRRPRRRRPRRRHGQGRDRGTASRRGPRRTPVIPPRDRPGRTGPRRAPRRRSYAAILAEHPGADLEPVGRAFDLAVAAHDGQKRATRRAVRHPPDRLGPDPGRAGHRHDRDPGRAPPRRPRGHRVQPDRRRGALRRRGRPARRRRDQAVASSAPTATSSSRPRTSARCCWRWPRTSGSS